MDKSSVVILLATFNGAKYLKKQLNSIINQTHLNWELVIRDDGSNDNTIEIIKYYEGIDKRISYIQTQSNIHGACANFSELYKWTKENKEIEYLMFSDQDDIWLSNKIEKSMSYLKSSEQKYPNLPILIYSNLKLIDENDDYIKSSIKLLNNVGFNRIMVQNYVFGCTTIFNKQLFDLIDYIPKDAENHDYWVALVATAFGKALLMDDHTILYRQHASNVTSQGSSLHERYNRYVVNIDKQLKAFRLKHGMLHHFLTIYDKKVDASISNMTTKYLESYKKNRFQTLFEIIRYKLYRMGLLQTISLFYIILFYYKSVKFEGSGPKSE